MENQNNEEIKKLQDDLSQKSDGNSAIMSEDQANNVQTDNRNYDALPDHEKRVVEEKTELSHKIIKLDEFINTNPIFKTLSRKEQLLLKRQLLWMKSYWEILNERVALFFMVQQNGSLPEYVQNHLTPGEQVIGLFGTENYDVFVLKALSAKFIDETQKKGKDGRRIAIATTEMEKTQMMAVKSLF